MSTATLTLRSGVLPGYFYSESISDTSTGDTVIIPPLASGKTITCTLVAGANTGKFQVTTSSDAAVTAGTATWQDWAEGDSTGTVSDVLTGPVTGLRGVSVSGAVRIEVVI